MGLGPVKRSVFLASLRCKSSATVRPGHLKECWFLSPCHCFSLTITFFAFSRFLLACLFHPCPSHFKFLSPHFFLSHSLQPPCSLPANALCIHARLAFQLADGHQWWALCDGCFGARMAVLACPSASSLISHSVDACSGTHSRPDNEGPMDFHPYHAKPNQTKPCPLSSAQEKPAWFIYTCPQPLEQHTCPAPGMATSTVMMTSAWSDSVMYSGCNCVYTI